MIKLDILISCILLLHRENQISAIDSSKDLVKSVLSLNKQKSKKILMGDNQDVVGDLYSIVKHMATTQNKYDLDTIIIELSTILKDEQDLLKTIKSQLTMALSDESMQRSIIGLRNKILTYFKETSIIKQITDAYYALNNDKIDTSVLEYTNNLIGSLEGYCNNIKTNDPGLVDELSISSKEDVERMAEKIRQETQEGGILKTGWRQLNRMLQGGFRKGECCMLCALQHNYKSGFTQSLVMQIARYNKPLLKDPKKKPCIVYFSLEDEIVNILRFMYRYLYFNENKKLPDKTEDDISLLSPEQLQKYVYERLCVNGYEIKLYRADPAQWTYKNIFNKVTELETEGYEIHAVFIDYLAKLPTTFCDTTGPTGTAMRDLYNRCRNFFSSKGILCVTPTQLSTEAKQLIRNGVPEKTFVKDVAGRGYTEMSKQLDQVVDLELYIHIAKLENGYGLTCHRGKHRVPSIIDDKDKYFILKFPNKAPIPEDVNDDNFIEYNPEGGSSDLFADL